MLKLIVYSTKTEKQPFSDWIAKLDSKSRSIILARLARVRLGNFGDCKVIKNGHGVWELRVPYGPGYRIYFGKSGMNIIVLLVGGDKGSQNKDITKAKHYWLNYKEEHEK